MAEFTTIARPYAQAVFKLAQQKQALPAWSDMLGLAAVVAADAGTRKLLDNPQLHVSTRFYDAVAQEFAARFGRQHPAVDAYRCDDAEYVLVMHGRGNDELAPSKELLDEFKKRRGYDLRPLLPALVLDAGLEEGGIEPEQTQPARQRPEHRVAQKFRAVGATMRLLRHCSVG